MSEEPLKDPNPQLSPSCRRQEVIGQEVGSGFLNIESTSRMITLSAKPSWEVSASSEGAIPGDSPQREIFMEEVEIVW